MLNVRTQPQGESTTNEANETKGGAVQNGRLPSPNMIERTIYKELDGEVIREKGRIHRASRELEDFDSRIKNSLYQEECRNPHAFSSGDKQWLKQASWFNK